MTSARSRARTAPAARQRRSIPRLVWLLAGTFLIKLIVVLQLRDHPLLQADAGLDTTTYVDLARRVVSGDVLLGPQIYYVSSPLYIYFVATVLALGGSLVAVRLVQVVLGTVAVGLVFVAARQWFGPRAGWCAGALAALCGAFTFNEVLLIQAALDPVLVAAALTALAVALSNHRGRWYLVSGALLGLATLNRPNVLPAALAIVGLLASVGRRRGAALAAAGLTLALAPVALRNAAVAGDWSPLPSQGGLNFYIGNNPEATGSYRPVPGIRATIEGQQIDGQAVAAAALGHPVTDREASSYFYRRSIDWMTAQPRRAAGLYLRKLAHLFNRSHVFLNYSYPFFAFDARTLLAALPAGEWMLIPLGLVGLGWRLFEAKSRVSLAIWSSFVPVYAMATAAFFVADRYRLPLLVPLAAGAGAAVDGVWRVLERRSLHRTSKRDAIAVAAATTVLVVAVGWPMRADDGRPEERARMAERLIRMGDPIGGDRWAALAEENYPRPAVLQVRIGRQLMQAGQARLALPHFERAAAIEPDEAEVQYRLGQALAASGRVADALPHLEQAVAKDPSMPLAGYELARARASQGDRDGALRALRSAVPTTEDAAQNLAAFGGLAMQLHDAGTAEDFFRRAVAKDPVLAAAHQQLGLVLGMQNRLEEAARELGEAVRLNPSDPTSHLNLAVVFAQASRFREARAEAQEALRLAPSYTQARQLLAALPPQ